jgi:transmembrane protein TMEM260 (protein O-mannosyltransferase)
MKPSQNDKAQGARGKAQGPFTFHFPPSSFGLWDLGLGVVSLLLYTFTLSPGLLPADAGEYQVVGAVLGVAHPPGFALYTLLNWLTSRALFFLPPATAINFLSALFAALTLVLVSRAVRTLTRSALAGACAALALGFSTTFWAQATTANVRMPAALAIALALERLVVYRLTLSKRPERNEMRPKDAPPSSTTPLRGFAQSAGASTSDKPIQRTLALFALALGLGVSHHGSVVFVAALLGLYALWLDPTVIRRPWPLLFGLLPFLFWLYFPLRAGAFGAPPRLATLDGFLEHILARGFRADVLQFANPRDLPERFLILGNILTFEFTGPVLVLTILGALVALWRDRWFGIVLLLALAAHTFIAITYQAPQTVEYLLPSYVLMAALIGFAFAELFLLPRRFAAKSAKDRNLEQRTGPHFLTRSGHLSREAVIRPLPFVIITPLLILQFLSTFPSYRALARDTSTRDYAESVLSAAPVNAVILASWHWSTPLWYLQQVEDRRPDVEVRYVYPRTISLAQDWAGEINAALPARPVVVTSFFVQEFSTLPYRFLPLGPAWEVRAEPLTTPPAGLTGSQTFGDWTFLGYHLESASSSASSVPSVDADKGLVLTAAWLTSGPPRDINFYIHLIGSDGQLYGQMDVSHPVSRYISGEVLLDRYRITPFLATPPGQYTLTAGAYLPDGTRLAETTLTTIAIPQLPVTHLQSPIPDSIPFGPSIFFTHADLSPSGPVHPGETLTVDLHFLATRPIIEDDTVKVDLIGPNYAWRVQSDGTPAGGAIPTLKWIAGSRIADRHTLAIPANAAPGTAQLVLALYDSFTQQDLPLLDPALAALGPTVRLATIEIIPP